MAEGPIATAFVEVRPDTQNFGTQLTQDLEPGAEKAGRTIGQTIGRAIAAVGIGRELVRGLGEFEEARDIAAQTAAAIRSTGGAANVTADQVGALSERLSDQIAVDDDLIQKSANLLLTFRNVRNEAGEGNDIFDQSVSILQDMAAALGTDASSSAIQLGKALNDPVAGITALTRVGVTFDAQQKDRIRAFVEEGNVMEAQRVILEELSAEFGGSAAAQASGLDRLNVAVGNLRESVGGAVAPIVEALVPAAERVVDVFESIPAPAQTAIVAIGGLATVARPINEAIGLTRTLASGLSSIRTNGLGAVSTLGRIGGTAAAIGGTAVALNFLHDALENVLVEDAPKVDDLTNALLDFAESGRVSGAAADVLGEDLSGLHDDLALLHDRRQGFHIDLAEDFDEAVGRIDAFDKALAQLVDGGSADLATQILEDLGFAADGALVTEELNDYTDALSRNEVQARLSADATGELAEQTGAAVDPLASYTAGTELAEAATSVYADALERSVAGLRDMLDITGSVVVTEDKFAQVLRDAVETTTALNEGQASGAERRTAFLDFLIEGTDAADDFAASLRDNGASQDEIALRTIALTNDLFDMAEQFGLTEDDANELRDELDLMPEDIALDVNTNFPEVAADLESIREALEAFGGGTLDLQLSSPRFGRFHSGGIVGEGSGLPIGTEVPILAQVGERVTPIGGAAGGSQIVVMGEPDPWMLNLIERAAGGALALERRNTNWRLS